MPKKKEDISKKPVVYDPAHSFKFLPKNIGASFTH